MRPSNILENKIPPNKYHGAQLWYLLEEILFSRTKTGKEIAKPSRLEFLEKISVNNFPLSFAEHDTSGHKN